MDYLDEETLVWDAKESEFVAKEDDVSDSSWISVDASRGRSEFLHYFDKAENQLLNISSELLATTLKVSTLPEPEDVTTLRHQLVDGINGIKTKGAELSYPVAVIDKLCFLYAVVLDELIIYSEWGESRGWENKTLLSELFGMRNGGELFFTVADKALRQPHKMIDLLEIIYIFLNIGFKGQYRETGNDQLKSFIHQLEQLISQYRQTSAIHCRTRIKLPKVRKPTRRKRYFITTVFFLCLIFTSIALTYFWYNKTHSQRARDFNNLPDFSARYVMSGQVNDIVFISDDADLETMPQRASKVELVDAPPPPNLGTSHSSWLVQLATFSSQKNAENFVTTLAPSKYEAVVDEFDSYFRVIVRSESSEQAREIKSWYVEKDQLTPIIVRNTQNDNKNDKEAQ
ncbi:type IVB secretion system protein IcmH/DotU [Vibrio europaeus]|uniref:type IVB secretion system protein IcmH/DotU n=1 Tax=Vibrio europaeus TaxID=300876 RepID=UPI00233E670A|nr:type IVB secretion system protein IcmH/DotU [Vibrio europaeus]MDC5820000.1 type IVB secretion system protein IcmH/DotU [Vibrio europaeus]MDC5839786.1 type IVB secretion system protein IcmH/DotU [Vibrio europaeus]MDC5868909.1 type IVB secretion system protein IcmH/DotU [Vibrio europaeus]